MCFSAFGELRGGFKGEKIQENRRVDCVSMLISTICFDSDAIWEVNSGLFFFSHDWSAGLGRSRSYRSESSPGFPRTRRRAAEVTAFRKTRTGSGACRTGQSSPAALHPHPLEKLQMSSWLWVLIMNVHDMIIIIIIMEVPRSGAYFLLPLIIAYIWGDVTHQAYNWILVFALVGLHLCLSASAWGDLYSVFYFLQQWVLWLHVTAITSVWVVKIHPNWTKIGVSLIQNNLLLFFWDILFFPLYFFVQFCQVILKSKVTQSIGGKGQELCLMWPLPLLWK